jgi:hypothetical protein
LLVYPQLTIVIWVKQGDIAVRVAAMNPWWRDPTAWSFRDPDLRAAALAPFDYRSGCLRNLTPGGLYVLRGPRRAGKSTELKQAIAELIADGVPPRAIVHASVDGWSARDLHSLVLSTASTFLAGLSGRRYWFIDEITAVAGDWPATLKTLRDTDARFRDDTVVLTGSSASRLHEARKAFAGRRGDAVDTDRMLLPMPFTAFVSAGQIPVPAIEPISVDELHSDRFRALVTDLLPYLSELIPAWDAYLRIGGFPQAVAGWLTIGDVPESLVQAMWDVVYGDAIAGSRFSSVQTSLLLARLATNLCSPVNVSAVARDLDVGREVAMARMSDIAEAYLMWPCHKEQGLRAHLSAQSKWYFVDPLLARLAAVRGTGSAPDATALAEQQIGLSVLRALDGMGSGELVDFDRLLYYRSATGREIDFVGPRLGGVAIESKFVDGRMGRDIQTIASSPWFGLVASRSATEWRDDAWIVPAPIVALTLGG